MNNDIHTVRYGLGMIMKTGWTEFIKNWKTITIVTLLVYIPVNTLLALVPFDDIVEARGTFTAMKIYLRIAQILEFLIGIIAAIAVARIIEESMAGRVVSWKNALLFSLSRWSSAIKTSIIRGFIIFGLILLFIIPGVIWYVYYIFVIYVVALRGLSGKNALDYSKNIVKGQWWLTLGYSIVIGFVGIIAGSFLVVPYFFIPEIMIFEIITDSLTDVVSMLFNVMMIVFFLNCDYLKNRPLEAPVENIPEQL